MISSALPVTILGGYLGSGKTTLVNHMLRHANGRRVAVLVNDFGNVGIDADLIVNSEGEVMNLAGGCICCSFGSDLMGALLKLQERVKSLDHVLIETSGVALPRAIGATVGLLGALRLNTIVVLADAKAVRQQASDRYVGETVRQQLHQADLLVVSKVDLLDANDVSSVLEWVRRCSPGGRLLQSIQGRIDPELIFGAQRSSGGAEALRNWDAERPLRPWRAPQDAFESLSFEFTGEVDLHVLGRELTAQSPVVRAKGVLKNRDGALQLFQYAGGAYSVEPWAGKNFLHGQLVCIGPAATWDRTRLEGLLVRVSAGAFVTV